MEKGRLSFSFSSFIQFLVFLHSFLSLQIQHFSTFLVFFVFLSFTTVSLSLPSFFCFSPSSIFFLILTTFFNSLPTFCSSTFLSVFNLYEIMYTITWAVFCLFKMRGKIPVTQHCLGYKYNGGCIHSVSVDIQLSNTQHVWTRQRRQGLGKGKV